MLRVDFSADFPREVRPAVQALVDRYVAFIPARVRNILIRFGDGGAGRGEADIEQRIEYGFAIVTLYANWLRLGDFDREKTFVHEIVAHVVLEPLVNFTDDLIGAYVPKGDGRRFVKDRWRPAYEQAVDEMAEAMLRTVGVAMVQAGD